MLDKYEPQVGFTLLTKVELMRKVIGLKLTLYELRVLLALISLVNQREGVAYPPRRIIGEMTGINQRHVSRTVHSLCKRGLVNIVDKGSTRRSARYRVNINKIEASFLANKLNSHKAIKGATDVPNEVREQCLGGSNEGASRGAIDVPPGVPEEQESASKVQTKLATELLITAARAPAISPKARLLPRSSEQADNLKKREHRNSWRFKFRNLEVN